MKTLTWEDVAKMKPGEEFQVDLKNPNRMLVLKLERIVDWTPPANTTSQLSWGKQEDDDPWLRIGDPYESDSRTGGQDGKYLFFSPDKERLMTLVERAISQDGFKYAKVIDEPNGEDYVACIYWHDSSRTEEMRLKYGRAPLIKYRGYKTNAATRAGIYSSQFLSNGGYRRG